MQIVNFENLNSDFFSKILQSLCVPYRNGDKVNKKRELIDHYFKICEIKMLIVDEIHNILIGAISKQKAFMNSLKMVPHIKNVLKEFDEVAAK